MKMKASKTGVRLPIGYESKLTLLETEIAIKQIKDFFQQELSKALDLTRVSAPLFVRPETGLNDNLNGVERPVSFDIMHTKEEIEVVHSLAKWKRMSLHRYKFEMGKGLYTDMDAIRRDEELDHLHSLYVDQWDWEKIIAKEERTEEKLVGIVKKIYEVFKRTEAYMAGLYPAIDHQLPEDIFFITTQELEDMYPDKTGKERESLISEEKGAVFISKIGGTLKSGEKHDGRAPDYDDWELNGDIIFWNPVIKSAFELSSMGIRVDEETLDRQLKIAGCDDRREMPFHKMLLEKKLPYTVGGGIGQSRMCMFFLQKAHIGEVQASIWPADMVAECMEHGIELL
jgi:aspartate--ammonia ligase